MRHALAINASDLKRFENLYTRYRHLYNEPGECTPMIKEVGQRLNMLQQSLKRALGTPITLNSFIGTANGLKLRLPNANAVQFALEDLRNSITRVTGLPSELRKLRIRSLTMNNQAF